MDHDLLELLEPLEDKSPPTLTRRVHFIDEEKGEVEIKRAGGTQNYQLKSLEQVFGKGHGSDSINIQDERFHPLLMTIEHAIVKYYQDNPALSDGQVSLTLRGLAMNLEKPNDGLGRRIVLELRIFLSVHDWSKQEVKLAIRKVLQSVERHTKLAGVRGYLTFIRDYVPY